MINQEAMNQRFRYAIAKPLCQKQTSQLQAAMIAAQTLGELYALMEDYSYLEVMAAYNQFPAVLQAKFNDICCRDTQAQLAAIYTAGLYHKT